MTASYIQCFIDGAARNQGSAKLTDAACACVIFKNRKEIARYARPLGARTNNAAEYEALITCLLMCSMSDFNRPIIFSDSAVVVNHTKGIWKCRSEELLPYYLAVQAIKNEYVFDIVQVPRDKVWLPDKLCNIALDDLEKERSLLRLLPAKKE
jgi:ribonuclease HI